MTHREFSPVFFATCSPGMLQDIHRTIHFKVVTRQTFAIIETTLRGHQGSRHLKEAREVKKLAKGGRTSRRYQILHFLG